VAFIRRAVQLTSVVLISTLVITLFWFHQQTVVIDIPGFEPVQVMAAFAYLGFFLAGLLCASLYFAGEIFKKSWELRGCQKRLRKLEALQTSPDGLAKKESHVAS
jgi:hypothetical protein